MSINYNNPRNLCDKCETCEDRFGSMSDCMNICGIPLEILYAVETEREEKGNHDN